MQTYSETKTLIPLSLKNNPLPKKAKVVTAADFLFLSQKRDTYFHFPVHREFEFVDWCDFRKLARKDKGCQLNDADENIAVLNYFAS